MADGHQVQSELHEKPAGAPTTLEFSKAQSPNSHSGGSRGASTPGSSGKSPLKGGAYWFAGAGEEQGEHVVDNNDYRSTDSYWFAQSADPSSPSDHKFLNAGSGDCADQDGKELGGFSQKDREERLRLLRERQSEERLKRLEELKLAALHAQRVREQQEEERRRKIDELRIRDFERRTLVEERKKHIWEAERERREAILRKNLEREARIEAKRNANRSSIGFAFGSSTPRCLDGEAGAGGYFGNRRVASQSSVAPTAVANGSRHSAERELDANKKRATSVYSLDNKLDKQYQSAYEALHWPDVSSLSSFSEDSLNQFQNAPDNVVGSIPCNVTEKGVEDIEPEYYFPPPSRADRFAGNLTGSGVFVGEDLMTRSCSALGTPPVRGRRKTDLIPTIPVHDSPRTQSPATRTTPSSPSRPNSSMSQQSMSSHASQNSNVSMRVRKPTRRSSRPLSIAGTAPDSTMTAEERQGRSMERKAAASKPPRAKSVGAENVINDTTLTVAKPPPAARKTPNLAKTRPPATARPTTAPFVANSPKEKPKVGTPIAPKPNVKMINKTSPKQSPSMEQLPALPVQETTYLVPEPSMGADVNDEKLELPSPPSSPPLTADVVVNNKNEAEIVPKAIVEDKPQPAAPQLVSAMEDSVTSDAGVVNVSKPRITTEHEAKAALAEKRRLAREQAEREAELERQRLEKLRLEEEERIRQEEEERKRWEQEQDLLRKIEEERLQKAIEEQSQREDEEKKKKEEEARQKQEREEQDKKSREEQERIRRETEERLRKEEEERAERRKRVEAIMSRTRGKGGGTGGTPITTPTKASVDLPGSKPDVATTNEISRIGSPMLSSLIMESSSAKASDMELMSTSMPSMPMDQPDLLGNVPSEHDQMALRNGKNIAPVDLIHANGVSDKEVDSLKHKAAETTNAADILVDDYAPIAIVNQKLPPVPQHVATDFEQLIDLSVCPTSTTGTMFTKTDDFLNNADSVNSNISTNGPGAPFIAFEDNFSKKQETNMTDLLS